MTLRFLIAIIIVLLMGCAPCESDFRTREGIPVCNDSSAPDSSVEAYIDAAHNELKIHFFYVPTSHVEVYDYQPGLKLGSANSRRIKVAWLVNEGAHSYGHERFHQMGHKHPEGTSIWPEAYLNGLEVVIQDVATKAIH